MYTSNESPTFQKPSSKILEYEFDEDVWYDIAFLIAPDEIKLQVNCEDIHQVKMEKYIFENFDIYGRMYLGASSREGKESFVRVSSNICIWQWFIGIPKQTCWEQLQKDVSVGLYF